MLVLGACGPAPSGAGSPTFPQHRGFGQTGPSAMVGGTLVSEAECLMLEAPAPSGQRTMLIWPVTYRPIAGGQGVQDDGVALHVGDEVVLGGGEYTDEAWITERLVGPAIAPACRTGRYALVTSIVSSSP